MGRWAGIDRTVFQWFNGLAGRSPVADEAAAWFTSHSPLVFAGLFAVYFLAARTQPPRRRHSLRRAVIIAGVAGTLAIICTGILEHLVYRARPFVSLSPGQVHLLVPHNASSSFPSDHAAGSAGFAIGMWPSRSVSARWIFSVTALLVGVSRLVAGVHWPSDVAGSFALGGVIAAITPWILRPATPVIDFLIDQYEILERRLWPPRR